MNEKSFDRERARALDAADPLAHFREQFLIPKRPDGSPVRYLCGNSLGLQPRGARAAVDREMERWATLAVNGHFEGDPRWYDFHGIFSEGLAGVLGARPEEVAVMNTLTVNLHLLMISFYRPTRERWRIVLEAGAFPSDRYMVASQAALHGLDPEDAVVELAPRPGEHHLRTEDVEAWFEEHGETVATTVFGGVHYYTGQWLDIAALTRIAQRHGAVAGFDLAHAAGNVPLSLHDWGVDFAAFCTYKYLNAGPGAAGGLFVHERHAASHELPRLAGWWGNDPETRFTMPERFVPQRGAGGWALSTSLVLSMAPLRASLALFEEATMPAIRAKAEAQAEWLMALLDARLGERVRYLTPRDLGERGAQTSLFVQEDAKGMQKALEAAGFVGDFRPPNVVRIAPCPLYNTFEEIWELVDVMASLQGVR